MPLDPEPMPDGNIVLFKQSPDREQSIGRVLTNSALEVIRSQAFEPLYKSHFATCPNAKQHRQATPPNQVSKVYKANSPRAHVELADYMSDLSERYLFAGWHIGVEYWL